MDKRTESGKKVLEDFFLPKSKAQEPEVDEIPEPEELDIPTKVSVGDEKPKKDSEEQREQEEPREKAEHPDPDWMHSLPGYRDEVAIHEELAREYEERQKTDRG